jgi:hypothetical protein
MLFFRSEEHVDRWCRVHSLPGRPLVSVEQLWQLAVTWYGNRLTVASRRPGPDEMVGIFAGIGLDDLFWDPMADQWD